MSRKAILVIVLSVFLLQGWILYQNWNRVGPRNEQVPVESFDRREIEAGVPIQRKRIDQFIERTSLYQDFDETADALNDYGDDYNHVFDAGVIGSSSGGPNRFAQILADRRVARLYAELEQMPAEAARARCLELFGKFLDRHEAGLLKVNEIVRSGIQTKELIPVAPNCHALGAALFLCNEFCTTNVFLHCCDSWTKRISVILAECESDPQLKRLVWQVLDQGLPNKLLIMNLIYVRMQQEGCSNVGEAVRLLQRYRSMVTEIQFSAWNAHTNQMDFTHQHRGVPVDSTRVLKSYKAVLVWGTLFDFDFQRQEVALSEFLGLLTECTSGERRAK